MFATAWEILLVDDEPDVLSVSRLAMRDLEVYGLPLKIYTAESKAEALEFLKEEAGRNAELAVAFIDVVMETDDAGLELCQYIRGDMGNRYTQLFIRTGQPGVAPERAVIDGYDINGYFTKAETTEDKLYSLVKSGVRQYYWSALSITAITLLNTIIAAADSHDSIVQNIQRHMDGIARRSARAQGALIVGDRLVGEIGWDEPAAIALRDHLNQLEGIPLSSTGDKYVKDGKDLLISTAAQSAGVDTCFVARTNFILPHDHIVLIHQLLIGLATTWQRTR